MAGRPAGQTREAALPVGEGSDRDSRKGSRDSSGNKEIWRHLGRREREGRLSVPRAFSVPLKARSCERLASHPFKACGATRPAHA